MKNEGGKFLKISKWGPVLGSSIVVLVMLFPFMLLTVRGVQYATEQNNVLEQIFVSRNITLLIRSFVLAFFVGITCVISGFLIGIALWSKGRSHGKVILYVLFLMLLIPNYIHAQAWIFVVDHINRVLEYVGIIDWNFTGFWASWFVLVISYLAYSIGFSLFGLNSINQELIDLSRIEGRGKSIIRGVLLPGCKNYLLIAFNIIFVLCLVDYTIPSLFGVRLYPLYIYARFSGEGNIGMAVIDSLPLIILGVLVLILVYGSAGKGMFSLFWREAELDRYNKVRFSLGLRMILSVFGFLLIVWIMVPFMSLIIEVKGFQDAISSREEILRTVSVALLVSSIGLIVSYLLAVTMRNSRRFTNIMLPFLSIVFVMPAPLIGIGVNQACSILLHSLTQSIGILVVAGLIRFLPIGVMIMYVQTGLVNREILEAGKLYARGVVMYLLRIKLPMMLGGLVLTFVVMFALSAGELGASLMVIPPGKGTLTLKLYNYLHYGSSSTVAELSLALLIVILLPALMYGLITLIRSKHQEEE